MAERVTWNAVAAARLRYSSHKVIVQADYRGFRIEVTAQLIDGAWDADVRIRPTRSEMTHHAEHITCRKPTAKVAEERGGVYARRWVDRNAPARTDRVRSLINE